MDYNTAYEIALKYWKQFRPVCEIVKIAGSIRRHKPEVGDIELVCMPKMKVQQNIGLFNTEEIIVHDPQFVAFVNSFKRTKGDGNSKYSQLMLDEGIKLDLFMANRSNFGLIHLIRTGSADYCKHIMTELHERGFVSDGGFLLDSAGNFIPVPTEIDFYKITGIQFIKPEDRK